MAFNELLIAGISFIHIAVHLKWKKIEYKILYIESAIILTVGLLGGIYTTDMFYVLTGSWYYPIQPTDLVFMGLGLLVSTVLLDFLTKFYNLDRQSLLAILPWTITGQYRYLHEFVWVYHYWITMNVLSERFSDYFNSTTNMKYGLGKVELWPALLTHMNALLFIIFSIFNFAIILQAFTETRNKT
jgi:hypothetical protein